MVLHSLRIQNFALLEEVTVEFGTGLNILTGETGAGKSILIGALGTILGQRVLADVIRSGCDFLRVEAVFHRGKLCRVRIARRTGDRIR